MPDEPLTNAPVEGLFSAMDKLFKDEPAVLVDAYAWIFRAFHGLPDFRNSEGLPTATVHGFLMALRKMADFVERTFGAPGEFVVFFDRGGAQERLQAYAQYKANRPETPEELKQQVPFIQEALSAMGIPQVAIHGVEADDAIASKALELAREDRRVLIASNDKDFFQMLSDHVRMVRPSGNADEFVLYDIARLEEQFGLSPSSMVEYYALVGDSSDNVPGVRGIGPKTASRLLQKYQTVQSVYEHLAEIPKTTAKILQSGRSDAFLSLDLVRLRTDLPVDAVPAPFSPESFDRPRLSALLTKLELRRLSERLLGEGHGGVDVEDGRNVAPSTTGAGS